MPSLPVQAIIPQMRKQENVRPVVGDGNPERVIENGLVVRR